MRGCVRVAVYVYVTYVCMCESVFVHTGTVVSRVIETFRSHLASAVPIQIGLFHRSVLSVIDTRDLSAAEIFPAADFQMRFLYHEILLCNHIHTFMHVCVRTYVCVYTHADRVGGGIRRKY